jgi:hypothetical protein
MLVAGAALSAGAIALLARRLRNAGEVEPAQTIEFAVDADQHGLGLGPKGKRAILVVLETCPRRLRPLRDALRATT